MSNSGVRRFEELMGISHIPVINLGKRLDSKIKNTPMKNKTVITKKLKGLLDPS